MYMMLQQINIESLVLYGDNMGCLHWVNQFATFGKTQKHSVFIQNRLRLIDELCQRKPVTFKHVAGEVNPADNLTRPRSFKVLMKSPYYGGPQFIKDGTENVD